MRPGVRDHTPIAIDNLANGFYDRGQPDEVPLNHLQYVLNMEPDGESLRTRRPLTYYGTVTYASGSENLVRMFQYDRTDGTRTIHLTDARKFYDIDGATPSTPILTIAGAGAIDASVISLYNRLYISPHDGVSGLTGEFVYVYDGSSAARKAAGSAPTSATFAAADGAAGDVEAGKHIIAVAYETDSGFITKPGPVTFVVYTAPGSKKINITNVPTGPAGTAKRHILASKTIFDASVNATNQNDYELFFVPDGDINDNTTTSITINFFDSNLTRSADYLLDNLDEIPACVNFSEFNNSMLCLGEYDNPSIVRVSKSLEPEAFSEIDGFILPNPALGGGVRTARASRGSLYIFKEDKTFVSQATSQTPSEWPVQLLDGGYGCSVRGIAHILDSDASNMDFFIITNKAGVWLFNGSFMEIPLSWKIEHFYANQADQDYRAYETYIDTTTKHIYIAIPTIAGVKKGRLLVGVYDDGLNAKNIKWFIWSFPTNIFPTSIIIRINRTKVVTSVLIGSKATKDMFKIDSDSAGVLDYYDSSHTIPIPNEFKTAYIPDTDNMYRHFGFLAFYGDSCTDQISVTLAGANLLPVTYTITCDGAVTRPAYVRLLDLVSERIYIEFKQDNSTSHFMNIKRILLYAKVLWQSLPE